jgi:hypothetical protein
MHCVLSLLSFSQLLFDPIAVLPSSALQLLVNSRTVSSSSCLTMTIGRKCTLLLTAAALLLVIQAPAAQARIDR